MPLAGPALIRLMRDYPEAWGFSEYVTTAIWSLGPRLTPRDQASLEFLNQLVENADSELVLFAFDMLGKLGRAVAVDVILRRIGRIQSEGIRIAGIETIGRVGDHRVLGRLMDLFDATDDDSMRTIIGDSVASILNRVTCDEVHSCVLQRTLHSGNFAVLSASARLLSEHSSSQATDVLTRSLQDDLDFDRISQVLAGCGSEMIGARANR